MSEISNAISALGNIFVAAAAVAAAIAAFMGLNTWKVQNVWQKDTELTRDILLAVRYCSDEFRGLRSGWMSSAEMLAAAKAELEGKETDDIPKMHTAALVIRLRRLDEALAKLFPLILEADIVWNLNLESSYIQMMNMRSEVVFALNDLNEDKEASSGGFLNKDDRVIASKKAYGTADDELGKAFREQIDGIVNLVKPKLQRR